MSRHIEKAHTGISEKRKTEKFAGIRTKNKTRLILKSKKTQSQKINMVWHCNMLCLLSGGPRIYAGPL